MKICIISGLFPTPLFPHGGIFITRRIATLRQLGCEVDAYALCVQETWVTRKLRSLFHRWPSEILPDWISTDDPLVQLRTIKVPMNLLESVLNICLKERLFIYKAQRRIQQTIGKKRFNVIHGHWLYPTGEAVVRYAQHVQTPCVVTAHGSDVHRDMRKKYHNGCLWTLEHCTRAEFVSHVLLQKAIEFGYSGKNAQILPNGIAKIPSAALSHQGNTVGFVGNLLLIKRVDAFPNIFKRIAQKRPDTQFIIVGDGPLRARLEQETKNLNIHFTGRLSQMEALKQMQMMDVLLLPSRNEGWGCVAIEAHSCGVPVVGSSNGGIPEAIGDERFVVKEGPDFEKDFALRVIDVLDGALPVDAEALQERAKSFTWTVLQQQEIENYRCLQ